MGQARQISLLHLGRNQNRVWMFNKIRNMQHHIAFTPQMNNILIPNKNTSNLGHTIKALKAV